MYLSFRSNILAENQVTGLPDPRRAAASFGDSGIQRADILADAPRHRAG